MKYSEHWLREWVSPPLSTKELADQLTMAGLEVDAIDVAAPAFQQIVVGAVLSVEQHPQADKLKVTTVDVGAAEPLTIVCGAANVRTGVRVPTALIGATLPSGMAIKRAKLRGIESFGMLCSTSELGLSEQSSGLLILPDDAPIGTDMRQYLGLDDCIIEIGLTPNRGDCLSVLGLARDVAALNDMTIKEPLAATVATTLPDQFPIHVHAPADCPRYLGRVLRGLNAGATTPLWMKERLRRAGLRSLGPIVDVTNYVLLELGQPMHAFDLTKLTGAIIVRRAYQGESLTLLDDSTVKLETDTLVIADERAALAFAGVMGGKDSAVNDQTTDVFLECAFFAPDVIRGRGRRHSLQTDSSYRFERGVDFALQNRAMERATQLLLDICGGKAGPVTDVTHANHLPTRAPIALRAERVRKVLGIELDNAHIEALLKRLGMQLTRTVDTWNVVAPSYRFDIAIEVDLIEEIGRVYGYERIPEKLPLATLRLASIPEATPTLQRVRQVLVDRGYQETVNYSFVDPEIQALLAPDDAPEILANPISLDMSRMRTTLWSGLLKTVQYNKHRQQERVRVFEIGKRFRRVAGQLHQELMVSGVITGASAGLHWEGRNQPVDFYDAKTDVETLLALSGNPSAFELLADQHPALHPGKSASIKRNGVVIGWLGELHPHAQSKLDLAGTVVLFELAYSEIARGEIPRFKPVSKFPSIRRDLAFILDEPVTAQTVVDTASAAGGNRLKAVEIFDLYRGKGVADGKKSLAIALTIQDDSQTLTDAEIEDLVTKIITAMQQVTGATLRG